MGTIDLDMLRLAKKLDGRFYPVEDVEGNLYAKTDKT